MRIVRVWIIVLGVGLGMVGCAGGPQLIPVTDPTERLEFEGFSILPPQGDNWFVVPSAPIIFPDVLVQFFKKSTPQSGPRQPLATLSLGAGPGPEGSTAERLYKLGVEYSNQPDTSRFRRISFNISPDRTLALDCMRFDWTAEARNNPRYPGSIFIMDQHGFVCLHPDLPHHSIEISYGQRRLQEELPLSLEAEGEPFVKSLLYNRKPDHASP